MRKKILFSLLLILTGSFTLFCKQSLAITRYSLTKNIEQDSSELEFKTFKKAKSLMTKKDYQGAVKELESINTSSAFLKQMLINCYIELKNFPKARITLKEYYNSDGQSPSLVSTMKELEKKIATAYSEDSTSYQKFKESSTALKNYIKGCPYSFFAKEVMDRIDELDYKQAESINTEDAYMNYLSVHPNGNYTSEAKSNIKLLVSQQNDILNQDAMKYDRLANKYMVKVGLYSTLAVAGGIGTYFTAKKFIQNNNLPGQKTMGINDLLLAGFSVTALCSGIMAFRILKDVNRYKRNARNSRSQIRQIPSFSQIRLSPFTDFSTTGGISLNIKF